MDFESALRKMVVEIVEERVEEVVDEKVEEKVEEAVDGLDLEDTVKDQLPDFDSMVEESVDKYMEDNLSDNIGEVINNDFSFVEKDELFDIIKQENLVAKDELPALLDQRIANYVKSTSFENRVREIMAKQLSEAFVKFMMREQADPNHVVLPI